MPSSFRRLSAVPLALSAALVAVGATVLLAFPAAAAPAPAAEETVATQWGPLNAIDRDFLAKVRQAGLWEIPAGNWAQTRAGNERLKEFGKMIANEHAVLDEQVRFVAASLNVPLPDQPSAAQQAWLGEMNAVTGAEFDNVFAQRLRAAHGAVFSVVSQVRAGTRNELVRQLATSANAFVLHHITLLEATGLVNYDALPQPNVPGVAGAPALNKAAATIPTEPITGTFRQWLTIGLIVVAVVVAVGSMRRTQARV